MLSADKTTIASLSGNPAAAARIGAMSACLRHALRHRVQARPVLGTTRDVIEYLTLTLSHRPLEEVHALYLNSKLQLLRDETVGLGDLAEAPVMVRPILKRALELGASAVILAHNHPSGEPTPSVADVAATRALDSAADTLGVQLIDHIVLASGDWVSMRAQGLV